MSTAAATGITGPTFGTVVIGNAEAATFTIDDALRWARHWGHRAHPTITIDIWPLRPQGSGSRLSAAPPARNALYVAVDMDDVVTYIGQVCRSNCQALIDRFVDHHAVPAWAIGLWVLPLADDCDLAVVSRFERQMIETYHPPFNVQHAHHPNTNPERHRR